MNHKQGLTILGLFWLYSFLFIVLLIALLCTLAGIGWLLTLTGLSEGTLFFLFLVISISICIYIDGATR